MEIRELYQEIGGDYEKVLYVLKKEAIIKRFLDKFVLDQEFPKLELALAEQRDEDAFLAAHTLKSVTMNMHFTELAKHIVPLTESLRNGRTPETEALFAQAKLEYERIISAIKAM